MNFDKFSDSIGIPSKDIIEILSFMGYFKEDYSDWSDVAYSEGIARDIDKINKPAYLKNKILDYGEQLKQYYYSRNGIRDNQDNLKKSKIKEIIKSSEVLSKLARGDYFRKNRGNNVKKQKRNKKSK